MSSLLMLEVVQCSSERVCMRACVYACVCVWVSEWEIYVTVHAKTSLVCTKIEIHFFTPAYSYVHTLATCTACLPWPDSIGMLFWGWIYDLVELWPTHWHLWSTPIGCNQPGILPSTGMVSLWSSWVVRTIWVRLVAPCLHLGAFATSLPTPTPFCLLPTHPLVTLG